MSSQPVPRPIAPLFSVDSYPAHLQPSESLAFLLSMSPICSSLMLVFVCVLLCNDRLLASAQPTVGCGKGFTINLAAGSSVDYLSMNPSTNAAPLGIWGLSQGPISPNTFSTAAINLCAASTTCSKAGAAQSQACVIYGSSPSTTAGLCSSANGFTFTLINSSAPSLGATFKCTQVSGSPPLVGLVSSASTSTNHPASTVLCPAGAHTRVSLCASA